MVGIVKITHKIGSVEFTLSDHHASKESFNEWFHQKRRHITTGKKYKTAHLILLATLTGSVVLFHSTFLALIVIGFQWYIVLGIFGARMLIQLLIFQQSEKMMGERGIWYCAPVFEILLILIYPLFTLSNLVIKPGKWKTI